MRIVVRKGGVIVRCLGTPLFIIPEWDGPVLDGKTGQPGDKIAAANLVTKMEKAYPGNITREVGPVDITI